jgi:hypothetical protein
MLVVYAVLKKCDGVPGKPGWFSETGGTFGNFSSKIFWLVLFATSESPLFSLCNTSDSPLWVLGFRGHAEEFSSLVPRNLR